MTIYIIVANDNERVKECCALTTYEQAQDVFLRLRKIYGGANVALASRALDEPPSIVYGDIPNINVDNIEQWKPLD